MSGMQPWKLILIGFILVLFGAVAPLLMVIQVVESSIILNLLSYAASVVGLFLGLIGAALYVRMHRS